ncbi:energy transducer TonB [Flavobacterium psychrophilum]|uniref:energy transducer TonB n=1 Tax=Flavobacterium psychrophilum TaxID=96345 RepID=UPI001C8F5935|nr:energy transducer TonB [Flavobacterium psychrophilum]EKT4499409.1 energy transducer TonB [Flavobacterium psychrophilum]ELY1991558.1 energy transducer TonB [Flavobacterium psychrophilum]QZK97612.1 energy transducer TonB [Flavobacterium psychrophilum]
MSKLNINKNEWLELVFEGKNKEYGAYQLRQENGKTTMKAFFSAIALISGIALLPVVLSSFTKKPVIVAIPTMYCPITPVNLQPKKEEPKTPKTNAIPVVVKKQDAPKTEIPETKPTNNNTTKTGNNPETGNTNTGGGGEIILPIEKPINDPFSPETLDRNPNFPGGINEFLKTVGKKFTTPELDEEKTIKILVYFVVERDGTLSNITVPDNPGFGLDIEAIRVLKAIKTKWEPGIYKGKPVRTSYSLPIVVKTQ